jgi:hypothetical protein
MAGWLRGLRGGMGFNGGRSRGGADGKKSFVVAPHEKMKPRKKQLWIGRENVPHW